MVQNAYPKLSQIYQTKIELGGVKQFIPASDCAEFFCGANAGGSEAKIVIQNTYPKLSQTYQTKIELGGVKQFTPASDCAEFFCGANAGGSGARIVIAQSLFLLLSSRSCGR